MARGYGWIALLVPFTACGGRSDTGLYLFASGGGIGSSIFQNGGTPAGAQPTSLGSSGAVGGDMSAMGGAATPTPGLWATIDVDFVAASQSDSPYVTLHGRAVDAPALPTSGDVLFASGSCKLVSYQPHECSSCAADEACIGANQCQRIPRAIGMDTLTLTGLQVSSHEYDRFSLLPTNYLYSLSSKATLAYPPCQPGDEVSAAGGEQGATVFVVTASCIEPLEPTTRVVRMDVTQPLHLSWVPSSMPVASRILAQLERAGTVAVTVECEGPDTGFLEVPAEMIRGLVARTSSYPKLTLKRISSASAPAGSGQATLTVRSATFLDVIEVRPN